MRIITGYTGEKHITPFDDASLHKGIFGSGDYVLPTGSQFEATIQSNTEIRIADGDLVMQGRHARIDSGYESLAIGNGSQGTYRNDLIVARYVKDAGNSVEAISLVVIAGTATTGSAADPSYNHGDISNGESRDFPLYRVRLNGINVESVTPLFEVKDLSNTSHTVKAWKNARPASAFAKQNVTIDGIYDEVRILACYSSQFTEQAISLSIDTSEDIVTGVLTTTWGKNVARPVEIRKGTSNMTVYFGSGEHYNDYGTKYTGSNNTDIYCIPLAIYGIKGVQ